MEKTDNGRCFCELLVEHGNIDIGSYQYRQYAERRLNLHRQQLEVQNCIVSFSPNVYSKEEK